MHKPSDELVSLKNIGTKSAHRLHAVGIHSIDRLREVGPAAAYIAVKQNSQNKHP